ncbi:alpha beta-hydrolase [Pyrrhoderma noxium]|uniref:Carboxypeptidase n=1 Tax=Pyrrhoderma noxium TaxID=2282107 RepID=A0A286UKU5_9AGAM|nr:alpha beta-hydrolase [Pyrrhoderma noxium]
MVVGLLGAASLFVSGFATSVYAQSVEDLPNSFPHDYPGKPTGDFGTDWQDYFLVKDSLPNVTFPVPRSFAGNVGVNRENHANDTLFFWAFETQNGSLTAAADERSDVPWAIWLNGGPGASSLLGLLEEFGPILMTEEGGLRSNDFAWTNLVDYVWVDQPVGVGFATADSTGYVADEDQVGKDFVGFLSNLVKVFPSLAKRPLLLTGESYAGTYLPYISKAIFETENPPVNLTKVAIGNGAIGTEAETQEMNVMGILGTYPQLIGYDPEVYNYFKEQAHLCGYDLNLTYPQTGGPFPTININFTTGLTTSAINGSSNGNTLPFGREDQLRSNSAGRLTQVLKVVNAQELLVKRDRLSSRMLREREEKREIIKRNLIGRTNGSIDPWYGCFTTSMASDYALNFSFPWSAAAPETIDSVTNAYAPFNPYDIPDARKPGSALDPTTFLNDEKTRAAIHAPTNKNWSLITNYPFNNTFDFPDTFSPWGDNSPPPSQFFSELVANMSAANVSLVIYNGNDDLVVSHFANEVTIQNTTFGGIQGFSKKPQTPFKDDDGNVLGVVHQERGVTLVIVEHAGHEVPQFNPSAALVMYRDFILGSNTTGFVQDDGSVVGGEDSSILKGNVIPGQSETIAAWENFFSTLVAASNNSQTNTKTSSATSSLSITTPLSTITTAVLASSYLLWYLVPI